jgi:hypothetical protein
MSNKNKKNETKTNHSKKDGKTMNKKSENKSYFCGVEKRVILLQ